MSKNSFTSGGRLKVTAGVAAATDRRPGGWAINDAEQSQIIDLGSDAVPADATFLGGSAYKSDGSRYVTFDTPSNAQFIGGQAIRADGALHMTTADPDVRLGQWGHTSNGAACAEAEIAVVSDGALFSDSTFTGPAGRTYFDSDGIMQTVGANEARTTYIGGNPYLLMEGARTNLLTKSEEFDDAAWPKADVTVTPNATTAPDGTTTADLLVESATDANHLLNRTDVVDPQSTPHSLSFFAKAHTREWTRLQTQNPLTGWVNVNLTTGAIGLSGGGLSNVVVTEHADGWWRISGSADSTGFGAQIFVIDSDRGGSSPSYLGDGTSGIYIWGAQAEEGLHASSYIKTTTAAATRATEAASLANSIIASLTEGTIYAEVYSDHLTSDAARHIAELESDANNFIRVQHSADGDLDAQITDGGASQAALAGTDLTVGQLQKVALTFKANEFSLYRDGTQLATDAAGTVPSVDTLLIGAGLYGGIKTLNVHTTAWSQAKAESETT